MQNFSQIGEVPWPRPFNITRILQSMTLNCAGQPPTKAMTLSAGDQTQRTVILLPRLRALEMSRAA